MCWLQASCGNHTGQCMRGQTISGLSKPLRWFLFAVPSWSRLVLWVSWSVQTAALWKFASNGWKKVGVLITSLQRVYGDVLRAEGCFYLYLLGKDDFGWCLTWEVPGVIWALIFQVFLLYSGGQCVGIWKSPGRRWARRLMGFSKGFVRKKLVGKCLP